MTLEVELSRKIRNLAVLFSIGIAILHCATFRDQAAEISQIDLAFQILLSDTVVRCGVPYFLVVSGFFLVFNKSLGFMSYRSAIVRRIITLYVPFLLWNAIYFLYGGVVLGRGIELNDIWVKVFGLSYYVKPACMPLWYVRTLFLLIVVSPVLVLCVRKTLTGCVWLSALALSWLAGGLGIRHLGNAEIGFVLFFSFGLFAGIHFELCRRVVRSMVGFRKRLAGVFCLITILTVYLKCTDASSGAGLLARLAILIGLPTVWLVYDCLPRVAELRLNGSFLIYVVHMMLIGLVGVLGANQLGAGWKYIMRVVLSVPASVMVASSMQHFFSAKILRFLCGGRE